MQLVEKLAHVAGRLQQAHKNCLAAWLQQVPLDHFASRCVRPIQNYLTNLAGLQVACLPACLHHSYSFRSNLVCSKSYVTNLKRGNAEKSFIHTVQWMLPLQPTFSSSLYMSSLTLIPLIQSVQAVM